MQFVTKNSSLIDLYTTHENKKIANIINTKVLWITQDNTLIWKTYIDRFIPKLSSAYIAIRAVRLFVPRITQDGILFLLPLEYHVWNNNLWELIIVRIFLD